MAASANDRKLQNYVSEVAMLRFVIDGPYAIKSPTRVTLGPRALTFRKPKPRIVCFTRYCRLNFNVDFFSFIVV